MPVKDIDIVFTDFDGTLANSHQEVDKKNLETLRKLKNKGIVRAIATGRSLYSFNKIIPNDFPIDYLIFSSGAGILDFKTKKLLKTENHLKGDIQLITQDLTYNRADFMVHFAIPENHKFVYYISDSECLDFNRRLDNYKEFAIPYDAFNSFPEVSAQIIAVFPDDLERFAQVKKHLSKYKIIRTTSPIDGTSIWMEIFPKNVSKGHAAKWLCDYLNLSEEKTIGIGNDFNDLDLLDFTSYSFVVENAPIEMKKHYTICENHNKAGFSDAILSLIVPK